MALQRFDTLIVGDGLAGLVVANLLTHFNYKVIVLRDSIASDKYQYDGFILPVSPILMPYLKFGELMSHIRQILSLSNDEFEEDSEIIDKFQYISKRTRIDIYSRPEDTIEELFCELGIKKEISQRFIESILNSLNKLIEIFNQHLPYPAYSFWDKRRLKENPFEKFSRSESLLNILEKDRERWIFKCLLNFITSMEANGNVTPAQEAMLGYLFSDKWLLLSSLERIKSSFIKRLQEKGVPVLNILEGDFQIEKRGFGYYLEDEKRGSRIKIDSFVLASDFDSISKVISPGLSQRLRLKESEYYLRYTTNFVVNSECIPDVSSKCIFYHNKTANISPKDLFQISISKVMKGRAIIKENKVISVTTFVDPLEVNKKKAEQLNKKAEDILLNVFPFADKYIISRSSVLDSDILLDANLNEIRKGEYKYNNYLFKNNNLRDGILLQDIKTGISNFINCFSVFSPIGIYGEFMTAVRAAEIISKNILGK